MTSENPIAENNPTPDTGRESDIQTSHSKPDITPGPRVPSLPPTEKHCHITCKTEKNWWDKFKPFLEIAGVGLLAVYTAYTIKMYHANKQAAEAAHDGAAAAQSAANTADATLKSSQKSFEIDQRPYMVTEAVQFSGNGLVADKGIQANVTFKNIGRTPALRYIANITLLRYEPLPKGPEGQVKFIKFINSAFEKLRAKDAAGRKEVDNLRTEQDIAPGGTIFHTNQNTLVVSTKEFPRIATSNIVLFYVGIASYTDAFNGRYQTEFCYFYFGTDPTTLWHICDAYNTNK